MPAPGPFSIKALQLYRPPCPKCGAPTSLISVESASEAGHDHLGTFECPACRTLETIVIKFR